MKTCKRRGVVLGFILGSFAIAACCLPVTRAYAASYYWDTNGAAIGAGDSPSGTWTASSSWSTSLAGTSVVTHTTTASDALYFVANPANNSGENAYSITVSGAQYANSLTFQSSGSATLSAGTADSIILGGGGITLLQFAYNSTAQGAVTISTPIALSASQTWTNNSTNSLTIANAVTNGGYGLIVAGPGNTVISGVMGGSGGLTKAGTGLLTIAAPSTYTGATTISAGTLNLSASGALQSSTLFAPTTGSVVFSQSVTGHAFAIGALSGSGNITLQDASGTAIALTMGGNNASTTYSGVISGSGSLITAGMGSLTLTGSNACNGVTLNGGSQIVLASTGSLTLPSNKNLYIGGSSQGAMIIQDSATVRVGGELDVNYQNTGGPSAIALASGSLSVTGATYIGRSAIGTDPSNTNAAFYQTGGSATFGTTTGGPVVIGYNGTATSLYELSGGTSNIKYGLQVGCAGNGQLIISGSGTMKINGPAGCGLVIGEDPSLATAGAVTFAGGSLSVTGGMNLGNAGTAGGGIGTFTNTGGTLNINGGLVIAGISTFILDDTAGAVTTNFTGSLSNSNGMLVVVPQNGHLSSSEGVVFHQSPTLTNNILGPWAVVQASANDSSGDYLTTTGTGTYALATASYYNGLAGASGTNVVSVTGTTSLTQNTSAYVIKLCGSSVTTVAASNTLSTNGMILNGGTLAGGKLALTMSAMLYAGSATPSVISSTLNAPSGIVKFGSGTLVLLADNSKTLSGGVLVGQGILNVQSGGALGSSASGNSTMIAAGATLQILGNSAVGSIPLTINGSGVGGIGALENVQDSP